MESLKLKNIIIVFLCLHFIPVDSLAQNQGINNMWLFGYGHCAGSPYGATNFDFNSGILQISTSNRNMNYFRTAANISDVNGNLLIYTNGYYVADANNDTMKGSSGFNPSTHPQSIPSYNPCLVGLNVPQACLILQKPGSITEYYIFHNTLQNAPQNNIAFNQYFSLIDISLNNGLGEMLLKNQIIIADSIGAGKLTACKHANGRDWWVVFQRVNSNKLYILLLTPAGISGPYSQNIGQVRPTASGQTVFSPDGTKFAYYYLSGGLEVMDFDRCNGLFSNSTFIPTGNYTNFGGGTAFSANSQFLYIGDLTKVYQYDVNAANILSTEILIAEWDSFYSPNPPFATLFEMMQLGPDGKIYISTGNGGYHLHEINFPDSAGLSCNLTQHSLQLPLIYSNALPNHPNYFLGALAGSPCDTLTGVGLGSLPPDIKVRVYPNPNNGVFTLSYPAKDKAGLLELYDVNGRLVHREEIAPWSQFKRVELTPLSKGIYFCRLRWGSVEGSIKVLVE